MSLSLWPQRISSWSLTNGLILPRPSQDASTFRTRSSASSYHTPPPRTMPIATSLNIFALLLAVHSRFLSLVLLSSPLFLFLLPMLKHPDNGGARSSSARYRTDLALIRIREFEISSFLPVSAFLLIELPSISRSILRVHREPSRIDYYL